MQLTYCFGIYTLNQHRVHLKQGTNGQHWTLNHGMKMQTMDLFEITFFPFNFIRIKCYDNMESF